MRFYYLLYMLSVFSCNAISIKDGDENILPVSHQLWDNLLKKNVSDEGAVNYKNFIEDSIQLNEYLNILSNNPPNSKTWSKEDQLAYWINGYNAFTIQLIIRNYPLKSIKDIVMINIPFIYSPWDMKFITIDSQKLDLNNIEHDILRQQYNEPRIHFAIVCASQSCPKLRNEAFNAEQLEKQLNEQANYFINDTTKNILSEKEVKISKIFDWFKNDFTKQSTLIDYLNIYAHTKINPKAKISFMDYDWRLNE